MPPKKTKKKDEDNQSRTVLETIQEPVVPTESTMLRNADPYWGLRYTPMTFSHPKSKPFLRTTKVSVMKKRPGAEKLSRIVQSPAPIVLSSASAPRTKSQSAIGYGSMALMTSRTDGDFYIGLQGSRKSEKFGTNFMTLDPRACALKPLTTWVSPGELPLTKPPPEMLKKRASSGEAMRRLYQDNLLKEAHSLVHFDEVKHRQLKLENYLMKRLGKQRSQLLLRRDQLMPYLEPDGLEKSITRQEVCEDSPPDKIPVLSFFEYGKMSRERNGLTHAMTKREKGHNVITEWFGSPHVTDFILKELGAAPIGENAVKRAEIKQEQARILKSTKTDDFVPLFPGLAVIGAPYKYTNATVKVKETTTPKQSKEPRVSNQSKAQQKPKYGIDRLSDATIYNECMPPESPATPKPQFTSGVVLNFGGNILSWHPKENTERVTSCYTVEIGCTAELGQSAVSSTSMTNLGSAAIRYHWVRMDREKKLCHESQKCMRFAFDYWGGVILPGETYRVPALFKANKPGYFSEDWRLVTQPVLECGAPVILRLWGITSRRDVMRCDREMIEKNMRDLITQSVVTNRVTKIIDNLPLKEVPLKDTRFQLVHLGPDLFQLKNPTFKYHSASVYRLGKMLEIFENQLASCPRGTIEYAVSNSPIPDSSQFTFAADDHTMSIASMRVASTTSSEGPRFSIAGPQLDFEEEEAEPIQMEIPVAPEVVGNDDEFSPKKFTGTYAENIEYFTSVFLKKTNLDVLLLQKTEKPQQRSSKQGTTNAATSTVEHTETPPLNLINVIDPDFEVNLLRANILWHPRVEIQESAFGVMNEELAKLSFRPFEPKDNWKVSMGHTYLCQAMDRFQEYAIKLKERCCQGQYQQILKKKREEENARIAAEMVNSSMDIMSNMSEQVDMDAVQDEETKNKNNAAEGDDEEKTKNSNNALFADADESETKNSNNANEDDIKVLNIGDVHEESSKNVSNAFGDSNERKMKNWNNSAGESNVDLEPARSLGAASTKSTSQTMPAHRASTKILMEEPDEEDVDFMQKCIKSNPREVLTYTRYQDQYYSRLHTCMYELLSEFVDTMDKVWTTKTVLTMDQTELGFTKIRNIATGVDINNYLNAPLPPPWIKLAQKLDGIAATNKARTMPSNKSVSSTKV